jgi:hypothetical protein
MSCAVGSRPVLAVLAFLRPPDKRGLGAFPGGHFDFSSLQRHHADIAFSMSARPVSTSPRLAKRIVLTNPLSPSRRGWSPGIPHPVKHEADCRFGRGEADDVALVDKGGRAPFDRFRYSIVSDKDQPASQSHGIGERMIQVLEPTVDFGRLGQRGAPFLPGSVVQTSLFKGYSQGWIGGAQRASSGPSPLGGRLESQKPL